MISDVFIENLVIFALVLSYLNGLIIASIKKYNPDTGYNKLCKIYLTENVLDYSSLSARPLGVYV